MPFSLHVLTTTGGYELSKFTVYVRGGGGGGGGNWWWVTKIKQGERVNSNSGQFCDNVISEYRGPQVHTIL